MAAEVRPMAAKVQLISEIQQLVVVLNIADAALATMLAAKANMAMVRKDRKEKRLQKEKEAMKKGLLFTNTS